MKITILENSKVKYNGRYLTPFQTYLDIDETTCEDLIRQGAARLADDKISAVSYESENKVPKTARFDPKANGGFVAEAVIDPEKRKKLEEEGKLNDSTPVTGKDSTVKSDVADVKVDKEEIEVTDKDGKTLTEEEVKAKEAAAAAGAPSDKVPTVGEANKTGEVVS